MFITATEFVTRVRAHLNADEVAVAQWIPDPTILQWVNQGVMRLWRRLARAGRAQPFVQTDDLTPVGGLVEAGDEFIEPLVIYSVADVTDGYPRYLRQGQAEFGPVADFTGMTGSSPVYWTARYRDGGGGGAVQIVLSPSPTSGTFRVSWLPKPGRLVTGAAGDGEETQINIPAGMEEFPILYAVRMGFAREGAAPPSVQRMYDEMIAELDLAAETFLQSTGPRVINRDTDLRGWRRPASSGPLPIDWWWAP